MLDSNTWNHLNVQTKDEYYYLCVNKLIDIE